MSEIANLRHRRPYKFVGVKHEYIVQLDVSMHNSGSVEGVDTSGHLGNEQLFAPWFDRLILDKVFSKVSVVAVLDQDIWEYAFPFGVPTVAQHGENVGVRLQWSVVHYA